LTIVLLFDEVEMIAEANLAAARCRVQAGLSGKSVASRRDPHVDLASDRWCVASSLRV
jgi:hypothetical protein